MSLQKKIEWLVLVAYTLINIWILSFFDSGSIVIASTMVDGNSNLFAIFTGLFLNTALILYAKLITNKTIEAVLLIIYSYLNLRVVYPFLDKAWLSIMTMQRYDGASAHGLFGITLGLFLNAALIIYWLKSNYE